MRRGNKPVADGRRWKLDLLYIVLFICVYITWFYWLEANVVPKYVIHSKLDDWIPFCEWFVIFYFAWFLFVPAVLLYLYFHAYEDYKRTAAFLFSGMLVCLFIYTLFPNGQNLRPLLLNKDNVFTSIIRYLYTIDTKTNVCPSIHVFNSLAVQIGIQKARCFKHGLLVKTATAILSLLICASTVLLKQHSILDVISAVGLTIALYLVFYLIDWLKGSDYKKGDAAYGRFNSSDTLSL